MQLLYSVTVKIDRESHEEWYKWMIEEHIPKVMETGHFLENRIFRMLDEVAPEEGFTYNFQYLCPDATALDNYLKNHAPALQTEHSERYKDKFVAFRTILKKMN